MTSSDYLSRTRHETGVLVLLQQPSHRRKLERIIDQVDQGAGQVSALITYEEGIGSIPYGDKTLLFQGIKETEYQRVKKQTGLSTKLGISAKKYRDIVFFLLRAFFEQHPRTVLRSFKVAKRWAKRRQNQAESVISAAGNSKRVLLFQNSSLDLTGLVSERLGSRAIVLSEAWQMPSKRQIEFNRRLGGQPIGPRLARYLSKRMPDLDLGSHPEKLGLTLILAFLCARAHGGFTSTPFLLNDVTQSGARMLYSEPALLEEYRSFAMDTSSYEAIEPVSFQSPPYHDGQRVGVVLNPPSDYYLAGYRAWTAKSYQELLEQWIGQVGRTFGPSECTISLHPGLKPDSISICRAQGIKVSELSVGVLIARADLYVSYISTTTRWASRHGKRMIVSDCYNMLQGIWPNIPNAHKTDTEASFRMALDHISRDTYVPIEISTVGSPAKWPDVGAAIRDITMEKL